MGKTKMKNKGKKCYRNTHGSYYRVRPSYRSPHEQQKKKLDNKVFTSTNETSRQDTVLIKKPLKPAKLTE